MTSASQLARTGRTERCHEKSATTEGRQAHTHTHVHTSMRNLSSVSKLCAEHRAHELVCLCVMAQGGPCVVAADNQCSLHLEWPLLSRPAHAAKLVRWA